jgi:hypothetical protein
LTYSDECVLLYSLGQLLLKKNLKWRKPEKVWVTALGLVRRCYLRKSLLQMNPWNALKVALILATKIEDVNINVSKTLKVLPTWRLRSWL